MPSRSYEENEAGQGDSHGMGVEDTFGQGDETAK